jgi:NAD(P)-dependent dehydrogenase (short-subunit alcohol dehydrogenase family)
MSNPEQRVALVTGASRGIGLAVVRRLSDEGMAVVGCAREASSLEAALAPLRAGGAAVTGEVCDVSDEEQVERLFAAVLARHGRLDVLVNNAGAFVKAPIDQMTSAQWDSVMGTNARGVFLCCRAAFRLMRGRGGDIVNISSLGGVKNVEKFVGTCAYVASKFAVAGLTEALAAEGRPLGIRVKAVSPGAVETEMLTTSGNALRSTLTPDALARIIAFLVSEAGQPLAGSNLEIYSNA